MHNQVLGLASLARLTGNRHGVFDTPCPFCSDQRTPANRRKPVLRIWSAHGFATYNCAHCGEHGHAHDASAPRLDCVALQRARAEGEERKRVSDWERIGKARQLWSLRRPLHHTLAETYLRTVRGYRGPLPATLGFLPSRGDHAPALIGAFGIPFELAPGKMSVPDDAVRAVHITRLRSDGLGKADHAAKVMIGRPSGEPLVLAPLNDSLALGITEGIEDALSVHAATGLGAWAAGSASQMPALADAVPCHADAVTIFVDDDDGGRRGAAELARRLGLRGIEVGVVMPEPRRAAA